MIRISWHRRALASAWTYRAESCRGRAKDSDWVCSSRGMSPFWHSWRSNRDAKCCAANPHPRSDTVRSCSPANAVEDRASFVLKRCPSRRSMKIEKTIMEVIKNWISWTARLSLPWTPHLLSLGKVRWRGSKQRSAGPAAWVHDFCHRSSMVWAICLAAIDLIHSEIPVRHSLYCFYR